MFILIYVSSAPRVRQQACDSFSVNIYWENKYIQSSNTLPYRAFEWKSNENISESTLKFKSVSSKCKLFLFYHISEYYNPNHSWDLTAVWHGRAGFPQSCGKRSGTRASCHPDQDLSPFTEQILLGLFQD